MAAMIWIGAGLALAGVAGLGWCVLSATRARREGLEGEAMAARLRRLVAVNLGALAVSAIGLMLVVLGVVLG